MSSEASPLQEVKDSSISGSRKQSGDQSEPDHLDYLSDFDQDDKDHSDHLHDLYHRIPLMPYIT